MGPAQPGARRLSLLALFYFMLPPIFWAGNAVVARMTVVDATPMMISLARWTVAFLILLPIGLPRMKGHWPEARRRWKLLAVLGFFGIACYNSILYYGLQTTTSINAMLVGTVLPAMTALLAWVWLRHRLGWVQAGGIVLAFLGVVVIVTRGDLDLLLGLHLQIGDGFVILATLTWAIYTVMVRRYPMGIEPLAQLTLLVIAGEAMLVVAALAEAAFRPWPPLTWDVVLAGLYLGIFPAVIAYYAWIRAVAMIGPTITSLGTFLTPVFTAFLAIAVLGEEVEWYHLLGMAMVVVGLYYNRPPRPVSE